MHEIEPKVSIASKFLTKTCLSANLLAVIANEIVIHANNPYGTLATKIPIPKIIHSKALIWTTKKAKKKKTTPKVTAIAVIISTNLSNYTLNGVLATPPVAAKSAIWPITVFSAIPMTIPLPLPYLHKVPKNAIFLVSNG